MRNTRVLWLLNHNTFRKFELALLSSLGISEIFAPKEFPYDEGNLSADIDYSFDATLSIPKSDLDVINDQDWYSSPSLQAWEIANRYFDVAIIGFLPEQMKSVVRHFNGTVILRAVGLPNGLSYSDLIYQLGGEGLVRDIKALGRRFWFGTGYQHLYQIEPPYLSRRNCFLPVSLEIPDTSFNWTGDSQRILFVCPEIRSSPYFGRVYRDFLRAFGDFPYTIGGAQPIEVDGDDIVGFVSREQHERNMHEHRVMFYHSQERNHIHVHPFEAIAAGMPLVFMGGGLLDTLGGKGLPGRCETIQDARSKIKRILMGEERLIRAIRESQGGLLKALQTQSCLPVWQSNFRMVLDELAEVREEAAIRPASRRKKVAVVLPLAYKGGTLRGAKLLAEAIRHGSCEAGEPVDVVLAYLDIEGEHSKDDFVDLPPDVGLRPYSWKKFGASEARRAMRYAGYEGWEPKAEKYLVMDDGMKQFGDCDLWVIVSDRMWSPLLPMRPIILMVYDYPQRYVPILAKGADQPLLDAARAAERVFVTTNFTYQDALQYAGISPGQLVKLPMLSPMFACGEANMPSTNLDCFVWTTNSLPNKNHDRALQALQLYYEDFGGELRCIVTGVNNDVFSTSLYPHLQHLLGNLKRNKRLRQRLTFGGNLPDKDYRRLLASAAFLWHPASIDNGTFAVIEAASLGVPSLSSDYPAMREIEAQFRLNLMWQDASDPRSMADALREMELCHKERRKDLPTPEMLMSQGVQQLAHAYWKAVRECL